MPGPARVVAVVGAGLATASLAWCGYRFATAFATPVDGPLRPVDVAWNTGLLATFALHHSLCARLPVRHRVAAWSGPGLERPVYVWVASMLLAMVVTWWRPLPGVAWMVTGWTAWGLTGLQAMGLLLALWALRLVGGLEIAGLRPSPPPAPGAAVTYTTAGPYGLVRHPLYAGGLLLLFANSPMTTTRLVLAGLLAVYVLAAIPLEERTLRSTNPPAWDAYARRVRYRLLPGVY
jgi:protein-S-isoprenylcysteine O-methyltransferase Ste14